MHSTTNYRYQFKFLRCCISILPRRSVAKRCSPYFVQCTTLCSRVLLPIYCFPSTLPRKNRVEMALNYTDPIEFATPCGGTTCNHSLLRYSSFSITLRKNMIVPTRLCLDEQNSFGQTFSQLNNLYIRCDKLSISSMFAICLVTLSTQCIFALMRNLCVIDTISLWTRVIFSFVDPTAFFPVHSHCIYAHDIRLDFNI